MSSRGSQQPPARDLDSITTPVEFGKALKGLRDMAGISMRRMQSASESRAARARRPSAPTLTKHRIESMEAAKHLGRVTTEELDLYLAICQVPDDQARAWRTTFSRVREIDADGVPPTGPPDGMLVRDRDVELLDHAFRRTQEQGGWGTIILSGGPGYGKTTLANYWASRTSLQTFTIWLRGQSTGRSTDRVDARGTLMKVSHFLNLDASKYDEMSNYDAADEFRRISSEHRLLVVLDDIANESQVAHLLPTERERYCVIATSRSPLNTLRTFEHCHHVQLGRLRTNDSVELLKLNISPDLIKSNNELRILARYACGIPLALRILAANIDGEYMTPEALAQVLKREGAALRAVSPSESEEDQAEVLIGNFRTILLNSYQMMGTQSQRTYRMLSNRLARRIDPFSVSIMADTSMEAAQEAIRRFETFGLIDRDQGYVFDIHDLLHEFALSQCSSGEKKEAVRRLSSGFYGAVNVAFDMINPGNPMVDHQFISEWNRQSDTTQWIQSNYPRSIIDWFIENQAAIFDITKRSCKKTLQDPYGPRLAASLFYFLEITNSWTELEEITRAALSSVDGQSDPITKGYLLRNKARIKMMRIRDSLDQIQSRPLSAIDVSQSEASCRSAIELYETSIPLLTPQRRFPDAVGVAIREVADTRLQLARIDPTRSNLEDAHTAYEIAAERFARAENPTASLSLSFGEVLRMMGRFDEAQQRFNIALEYALTPAEGRPLRHAPLAGHGLAKQAYLFIQTGNLQSAARAYDRSIEIFHAYGNWLDEARTLARKAHQLTDIIGRDDARSALEQAEKLFRDNGRSEADVASQWLSELGITTGR